MRVKRLGGRYIQPRKMMRSAANKADPSGTSGIVRAYTADFNRRWARLSREIRDLIVVADALHLRESVFAVHDDDPDLLIPPFPFGFTPTVIHLPFRFRLDPIGKSEDFMIWLNGKIDDGVLEVTRGTGGRLTGNRRWQGTYVRATYSRGLQHAERAMRAAGIPFDSRIAADIFNTPQHAETLGLMFTRQFTDLEGITSNMSAQMSRVLTDGLASGLGPNDMARNLRAVIPELGVKRTRLLARTEVIRVHAQSTLNRYKDAGVEGVVVRAEFLTAQDDRVCAQCEALETGDAVDLEAARGLIPVHSNCRCVWLPVLPSRGK